MWCVCGLCFRGFFFVFCFWIFRRGASRVRVCARISRSASSSTSSSTSIRARVQVRVWFWLGYFLVLLRFCLGFGSVLVRFLFAVVNLLFFNWLAFYLKIKRDFLPISRGVFQGVFPGVFPGVTERFVCFRACMLCVLCGVCGLCSVAKIKNRWLGFGCCLVSVWLGFGFCLVFVLFGFGAEEAQTVFDC